MDRANSVDAACEWRSDISGEAWDHALAALGGHPLQSALWGDARRAVDGIVDRRLLALRQGHPAALIRIEERALAVLGKVAWSPKGPAGEIDVRDENFWRTFGTRLGVEDLTLAILDPWRECVPSSRSSGNGKQTIWIDLSVGREILWKNLHKDCRYSVRRAERDGIRIEKTDAQKDVQAFFDLCLAISREKGFHLPGSAALMQCLLANGGSGNVETRLFVARQGRTLCAGAFVFRCGRSLHYFWGAVDRDSARQFAGSALQWAAILWGLETGCTRYDLEGIDPLANRGVYEFKRKLGGREVRLVGKIYRPLNARGRLIAWLDRRRA